MVFPGSRTLGSLSWLSAKRRMQARPSAQLPHPGGGFEFLWEAVCWEVCPSCPHFSAANLWAFRYCRQHVLALEVYPEGF